MWCSPWEMCLHEMSSVSEAGNIQLCMQGDGGQKPQIELKGLLVDTHDIETLTCTWKKNHAFLHPANMHAEGKVQNHPRVVENHATDLRTHPQSLALTNATHLSETIPKDLPNITQHKSQSNYRLPKKCFLASMTNTCAVNMLICMYLASVAKPNEQQYKWTKTQRRKR